VKRTTKPSAAPAAATQMVQLPPLPPPDDRLAVVPPGPDAMLTLRAAADIEEWIAGWTAADRLRAASIPLPGPLLLHGPTGTGKTSVTRMIARRLQGMRQVLVIDAMRVTESYMGQTSANIAKASDAAVKSGAVLVLEEVDALASIRTYATSAEVENTRSTTSIMRVLELGGPTILTSNRLDVIDPAVVRRCEYVVEMPDPTPEQRRAIVWRELGDNPGEFTLSLTEAMPLARRARRSAFLAGIAPSGVFGDMVRARGDRSVEVNGQVTHAEVP
jgi:SpoVK/Ycf46/Vps4 family AAA+-type ATPase